jgi:hypothetical protein
MLARVAGQMGLAELRADGVWMSQERMEVEAALHSLPAGPVRVLEGLGFAPTSVARIDSVTGPVLYLCDGRDTMAELAAPGPLTLRFLSVATDGQLLETGEPLPPRTSLGPGRDPLGVSASTAELLAKHREHIDGEQLIALDDADLHAGISPYRDRLQARGPVADVVGMTALVVSAVVLVGVGVAMSLGGSGWWLTLGVLLGLVVIPFLGWAEAQLGLTPGSSLGRLLVSKGLLDSDGVRSMASAERAMKLRRRSEVSVARRLEDLGFEPAGQAQVRRRGRFGWVRVYDVTTLVADGTLAAQVSMRDGPKKPRVVLQSLFSDTIIETVIGGGMGTVVFGDTYASVDVLELDEAVAQHWERAGERWPVQIDERPHLMAGLARFVEIARGEEAREHGRFAIRVVLAVLAFPLLLGFATVEDGEGDVAVVGAAALALDWLVPGVVAELGHLVGAQQREVSPAELESIGKEALDLDKPVPLWRRLLGGR